MSLPLNYQDLPELPLGHTLQDHIIDYAEHLIGRIEMFKSFFTQTGDAGAFNTARALQAIYDDLNNIVEFSARELELERGGDDIRTAHSLDSETAYIMVYRNGQPVHEFPFTKDEFSAFIAHQNELLAEMN